MPWRKIAAWIGGILLALVLLVAAAILALNTDPGRRFVADKLSGFETASGLKFQVGRLDGSLYGKLIVRDLRVSDTKGVFLTSPRVEIDWRPFEFIGNHIDIKSLTAGLVTLERLPVLKPTPSQPNAPILPNYDIDIGRLKIDRLVLAAPVTGTKRVLTVAGKAKIADRRAQVLADVGAIGGGDRLHVMLDAVPDDNRLAIDARLDAPAGGVVASLAGLKAPLAVRIGGRGDWKAWNGSLNATLGGQQLAELGIAARDGTFTLRGPLRPGLILTGPVARLTAPALNLDLTAALSQRKADTKLSLRSDALAVDAGGLIDLAHSRFGGVRVDARLLRPGAIGPNLNGRNVRLQLFLDGPFAQPLVTYRLSADAIGFGKTSVEGLLAEGRARVDKNRILIPVSAKAARVSGLSASVGGLLTNVTVNGDLAISGDTIFSDNLRIRSDRIDATAVVVADLSSGVYRGGLKGRVNNYLVQGVGIVNVTTDLNLVTLPKGGFGISGRFAAQTVRIDNASARNLLGGRTIVTGNVAVGPDAAVTVSRLRVAAPKLKITDGGGFYRPDGTISFHATGVSDQYGPLSVIVTGTVQKPQIRLRASRPNFGLGLSNVDATVRGTGNGYEIHATGGSAYGPFSADLFVATGGGGPLSVDIHRAHFAGIDFAGHVTQTATGPFAGTLSLSGAGFTGTVRLSAVGYVQAAQVSARANGAHIPSNPPILIQRAIIEARLVLYPNAPLIVADVQAAGVRQGALFIQRARARINYQGGRGTAALVADGENGARFHVAAKADLSPGLYRVAAQGNVNGVDFRTAAPAEIRTVSGGYELAPAMIVLPQGRVQLAGRYGPGLQLQAKFNNLDMAVFNAFAAGAGVGGRASGTLDFVQPNGAAFPRADLRLLVQDFTRSGATGVSEPVDLDVLGTLRPEGGDLRAVIRRSGNVIGRLQARLQPVAAGASWTSRLLAAPLAGGIRYNGPADVLWSLTGISGQQLSGPIGIAADFSGHVDRPLLNGIVRANALDYTNGTYGTHISAIRLTGRFTNDRLEIVELTGRAGDGTISAKGTVGLSSAAGYPIDIRATLDNARLARSDALGATVTGTLAVTNNKATGATVSGDLRLPEVRYQIVRQGAAEVVELTGVRRKGAPPPKPEKEQTPLPGLFKLDLHIRADNQVFVSGMGLESEWGANLRVTGTTAAPVIIGRATLVRGTYSFAGHEFDLDPTSTIRFEGGTNPTLAITATSTIEDVTITLNVTGTADDPQIALTSTPALPQDELLSRVLFGSSVTSLSATQVIQLAAALNSLRGSGGGLNPLGKLRSATGLSRLRILGADQTTGRGTAVAAGIYISHKIYLEVITDARGFTATQIEIALSRALSILSQTSSYAGTSVELRYRKNY